MITATRENGVDVGACGSAPRIGSLGRIFNASLGFMSVGALDYILSMKIFCNRLIVDVGNRRAAADLRPSSQI